MKSLRRGELIVLSGPSGVGKSSIVHRAMELHPELRFSVSATTRERRPSETEGESYYFVSHARFDEMVTNGELLEHAEYVGNCYGTPEKPVDEALNFGYDILLDIEVQGAMQVKQRREDATFVFVAAPSFSELERRLRGRGDTAPEKILQRLETARQEYRIAPQYDYLIVSETNQVDRAAHELLAIIEAARCRMRNRVHYLKED